MNKMEESNIKKEIRICEACGSSVEVEVGFNKNNFKKLFRKPTMSEWIELFIIIMVILSAFAYKADIENLKAYYESDGVCANFNNYSNYVQDYNKQVQYLNISLDSLQGNCLEGGSCPNG
jgi:hypothetical protein